MGTHRGMMVLLGIAASDYSAHADALCTRVRGLVPRTSIMSAKSPLMLSLSIRQLGSLSD